MLPSTANANAPSSYRQPSGLAVSVAGDYSDWGLRTLTKAAQSPVRIELVPNTSSTPQSL
jgi:hypothetical protein